MYINVRQSEYECINHQSVNIYWYKHHTMCMVCRTKIEKAVCVIKMYEECGRLSDALYLNDIYMYYIDS